METMTHAQQTHQAAADAHNLAAELYGVASIYDHPAIIDDTAWLSTLAAARATRAADNLDPDDTAMDAAAATVNLRGQGDDVVQCHEAARDAHQARANGQPMSVEGDEWEPIRDSATEAREWLGYSDTY